MRETDSIGNTNACRFITLIINWHCTQAVILERRNLEKGNNKINRLLNHKCKDTELL